jgi:hypothetical protein
MEKYRIISQLDNIITKQSFHIERKGLFKWNMITLKENGNSKDLTFQTYEDAEEHMKLNYFSSWGKLYKPYPNEYHYEKFSMYY